MAYIDYITFPLAPPSLCLFKNNAVEWMDVTITTAAGISSWIHAAAAELHQRVAGNSNISPI